MIDHDMAERLGLELTSLLNGLAHGVVVRDSRGRLVFANTAYEATLGIPPKELVNRPDDFAEMGITKADGTPFGSSDWPGMVALAGGLVSDAAMSVLRPDGRRLWLRVDVTPVVDARLGKLSITTLIDVTRRHQAEEAVRTASVRAEKMVRTLIRRHQQQEGIAELGRLALVGTAPQQLMEHAVALVASTLRADRVRILELMPNGSDLLLRAGVGWRSGLVGTATISRENTQVGYLLQNHEPLVIEDFRTDSRFEVSWLLRDHPVRSGIRAVIRGEATPFGELAAYTSRRRHFTEEDILFITVVANTLAEAFNRLRAEQTREQTLRSLQEVYEARQRLLQRLSAVIEEERTRIASDIHNDSLQVLAGLGMRLQAVAGKIEDAEHRSSLSEVVAALADAGHRLRRLIFDLRPDTLEIGLAPALRFYFDQTATGASPTLVIDSKLTEELPWAARLMVYRSCQEALNNVRKHADASLASIRLQESEDGVAALIQDDGVGFDVSASRPPGHIGLIAMRERIQLAGGRLSIESSPGKGTAVRFWIPRAQPAEPA
jgi:signal transduction histidine kinase